MRRRVVGYLAVKKDRNRLIIMINEGEIKKYFHADLNEALEVITGRRANCKIYKFIKG